MRVSNAARIRPLQTYVFNLGIFIIEDNCVFFFLTRYWTHVVPLSLLKGTLQLVHDCNFS